MSAVFWCGDDACEQDFCTAHPGPYRIGTHGESGGVGWKVPTVRDAIEAVRGPDLLPHLEEAEAKAWDSLARYKFQMFGYWAAIWVHLNRISGERRANPWKALVELARAKR